MRNTVLLLLVILIASCGEPENTPTSDTASSTYSAERADVHHSCCFTSEEQFLPFFPQCPDTSSGFNLDRSARDINLSCPADTLQQSYCTRGYINADSELVSVKIIDFCAAAAGMIDSSYIGKVRAYKSDKNVNEFNEFEVPGVYHGFTCYLPVNRFALLSIVVDNRFIVEISHYEAANSKSVVNLLGCMPIDKLATFGK